VRFRRQTFLHATPAFAAPGSGGTLRLLGAGLVGMALGCGGVAAVVLLEESATTKKTKRYIECGVAAVSLLAGAVLLVT
jgi:hypothetical protein